ncbi:unnamed protein product [Symbiodinium natans]|uniref:Uncharacterized protein n=1 Tax=Symbiodinium natans TaxID=878477 RepID=A0A812GDB0_9DINO|nr:unnamed protein product [Symbiodinium natans]
MKRAWRLLLLLAVSSAEQTTPVGKVVEMLRGMKAQGEKDKQDEEVQFAAYKQFCEVTERETKRSIQQATEKVEVLSAEIEKSGSDATRLGEEIAAHTADLAGAQAEKEEASKMRETERKDFQNMFQDLTESIDAIGRAQKELKSGQAKGGSLVQLTALKLPVKASRGLNALLSEGFEDSLLSDLQVPEFKSAGIIKMLEKLEDQFTDERLQLEKEETSKKHAFELFAQSIASKIAEATKEQQQKHTTQAKKLQDQATASSELSEAQAGLDVDQKYLADLTTSCRKKAADFEERQKLRGQELVALDEAIHAMSQISGTSLVQMQTVKTKMSALAQLRSDATGPAQAQVARFLQREATSLNSRLLSALAERARADPMMKVKQMIEQLIVRLKDQAKEETTKKAWCDAELSTNKATREEKSDAVSSLQAEIDELQAHISQLGEEITSLSGELTELSTAMSEATNLRQKEEAKNKATVKEAKEGQDAVAKAVLVLQDFYSKASQPGEALLQRSDLRGAPPIFSDEPYAGMQKAKGGVLAMLEVIESDFSRLEAEATASEAAAKKDFESFLEESKITKAEKSKEVEHKTSSKQERKSELITLQADLQGTEKELEAAAVYYEKLKPDCLDAGVSYQERKARREQEMKDLKEALDMLDTA